MLVTMSAHLLHTCMLMSSLVVMLRTRRACLKLSSMAQACATCIYLQQRQKLCHTHPGQPLRVQMWGCARCSLPCPPHLPGGTLCTRRRWKHAGLERQTQCKRLRRIVELLRRSDAVRFFANARRLSHMHVRRPVRSLLLRARLALCATVGLARAFLRYIHMAPTQTNPCSLAAREKEKR